jgi:integrase
MNEEHSSQRGGVEVGSVVSALLSHEGAVEVPDSKLVDHDYLTHPSHMTVGKFVENNFAPEHIDQMRYSGRAFYQAMLKHVIKPEEVDRIFRKNPADLRKKLQTLPDWPYLSEVRLCDVRRDDIARITAAARNSGYSVETVRHIRNVIGAIFSHAIRQGYYRGDNPVNLVKPLHRLSKPAGLLTVAQARCALRLMQYPEKELIFMGVFTGLSPAEIIGLQWRQINLTNEESFSATIRIPPMTIAVRRRWYRGQLESVSERFLRDLPIHPPLLQILTGLRSKSRFCAPDDFVLVSHVGTPVSHDNITARRLRPIARKLGVQALSAQVFQSNKALLSSELKKQYPLYRPQ